MGSQRVRHDSATNTFTFFPTYYRYIGKLFNLFTDFASWHFTKVTSSKIFYLESFRFSMQIFLTAFTRISIPLLNNYSDAKHMSCY